MSRLSGRPIIKLRTPEHSDEAGEEQRARVLAVSSGKGGVGKSSITLNLAVELAQLQRKVCIFDADTNLANINILTGLSPQYTLQDVLAGTQTLQGILLEGPQGIRIVPAASGMMDLVDLNRTQRSQLLDSLRELEQQFDFILLDTGAGISENVLGFLQAASEVIITITSEPTSLTDAFSLLKVLGQRGFDRPFQVVVNRVDSYHQAKEVLLRFSAAVKKYLRLKVVSPGYVLEDHNVPRSVMQQTPYTLRYPQSPASRCIRHFAQRVNQRFTAGNASLSTYLDEQYGWLESQETRRGHKEKMPVELNALLEIVHAAPFERAEQIIAQINHAWVERVESQQTPAGYLASDGFRAAIRFAGLIDPR